MKKSLSYRIFPYLIFIIGLGVYLNTWNHQYTLDDIPIVQKNKMVQSTEHITEIFKSHYWAGKINASDQGLYRPLTLTSYAIQNAMTGPRPGPFHVVNSLLHALVSLMVFYTIGLLFKNRFISISSAVIFAVHPIHTEAVGGIVGRAELLAMLFILCSIFSFFKSINVNSGKSWLWIGLSILSAIAAALSKELGFLIPIFIVISHLFWDSKHGLKPKIQQATGWILMTFALLALWFIRSNIVHDTSTHELWTGVSNADRIATALGTSLDYIGMMLLPLKLSADYWSTEVPIISFSNPKALIAIAVITTVCTMAILLRDKFKALTWGVLFFGIALFPVSNIPFAIGVLKAERILYAPSLGLIVAVVGLLGHLYQKKTFKVPLIAGIGIYALVLSIMTIMRNPVWKNNYTLAQATVLTSPDSPRMNNILGLEYKSQGKRKLAMKYFERAVHSRPEHLSAVVNLALMKKNFGDLDEAIKLLESAMRMDPKHYEAGINLIGYYRSAQQYQKAIKLGKRLTRIYPTSSALMTNLGNVYYDLGQHDQAQALWNKAKQTSR